MTAGKPVRDLISPRTFDFATRNEITEKLGVDQMLLEKAHRRFPVQWPKYYLDLAQSEAVARMGRPHARELIPDAGDIADPIADQLQRPIPFVVRKHQNRVIILAAKRCHFYCRFCFRREEPVNRSGEPGPEDWARIFRWLLENPQVEEAILSGGDPLTLSNEELGRIRRALQQIPSIKHWRIHSRAPVHFPQRVTAELFESLVGPLPFRLVTHYNHADEITDQARRIARLALSFGVPYKNQTVLLAGVNNRLPDQLQLWSALAALGIQPHYLHHPDRTPGNAEFRVDIQAGVNLYTQMQKLSRVPLPAYVLDLPDGRGKVPVLDLKPLGGNVYEYDHGDGDRSIYRDFQPEKSGN